MLLLFDLATRLRPANEMEANLLAFRLVESAAGRPSGKTKEQFVRSAGSRLAAKTNFSSLHKNSPQLFESLGASAKISNAS